MVWYDPFFNGQYRRTITSVDSYVILSKQKLDLKKKKKKKTRFGPYISFLDFK